MLKKLKRIILIPGFIVFQTQFNYAQGLELLQKFSNNIYESTLNQIYENKGKLYIPSTVKTSYTKGTAKDYIIWSLKYNIIPWWQSKEPAYFYESISHTNTSIKKPIVVTDDYLEFNTNNIGVVRINYADILFDEIQLNTPFSNGISCRLTVNKHNFRVGDPQFADALYCMQYQYGIKYFKEQTELFKPIATAYLKLETKPVITEDQRRLYVQGNALTEAKEFRKAIEYYNKAIAINPVAYPSGYYNLALLGSIIKNYRFAIFCMQKYLMLVPDASDAKEAQDKIYGWQALIN